MWILPSFGRVHKLRTVFFPSWQATCPTTPVHVVVSEDDAQVMDYFAPKWPVNWVFHVAEEGNSYCGEKLNWAFRRFSRQKFYGFLADDFILHTPGMLDQLALAAQDWNVAWANDGSYRDRLVTLWACGGELVRYAGWFAHPQFKHNCLDSIWHDLATNGGVGVYREDLCMTPQHPLLNNAEWDDTYRRVVPINEQAGWHFEKVWKPSAERAQILSYLQELHRGQEI